MIFGSYGYRADAKMFLIEIGNTVTSDPNMTQANAIPHLYNAIKKHMKQDDIDVWQITVVCPSVGLLKTVAIGVMQYMQGLGIENIKTIGC